MTVAELGRSMDADEYARWKAFYYVESEEQEGDQAPTTGKKKELVTDSSEVRRWFAQNA